MNNGGKLIQFQVQSNWVCLPGGSGSVQCEYCPRLLSRPSPGDLTCWDGLPVQTCPPRGEHGPTSPLQVNGSDTSQSGGGRPEGALKQDDL